MEYITLLSIMDTNSMMNIIQARLLMSDGNGGGDNKFSPAEVIQVLFRNVHTPRNAITELSTKID